MSTDKKVSLGFKEIPMDRVRCLVAFLAAACLVVVLAGFPTDVRAQTVTWQQTVSNGFGDTDNLGIYAARVFGGYIYTGTINRADGTQIYRSADATTWTPVVGPAPALLGSGFGNGATRHATNMLTEFGGYLYAGVCDETGAAGGVEIWRSANGTDWTCVVGPGSGIAKGFGNSNNTGTTYGTLEFNGLLYVGTYNPTQGTEIWRTSDGAAWTCVVGPGGLIGRGFGDVTNIETPQLYPWQGYLYAATYTPDPTGTAPWTEGGEIWRTDNGTNWSPVVGPAPAAHSNGFGNPLLTDISLSLIGFGTYLYAGAGGTSDSNIQAVSGWAEVWRSTDGTNFTRVVGAAPPVAPDPGQGFGDLNNIIAITPVEWQNALWYGMIHYQNGSGPPSAAGTGTEVWSSSDGLTWTQRNTDGFGDVNNVYAGLVVFNDKLVAGTVNIGVTGAQVWVGTSVADPGIDHHHSWYECAIATAAYGTPLAEEVKALSNFRDQYLLTNKTGQELVKFYYAHSPRVADFIRNKESLKAIVRTGLKPLVWIAEKTTN